MAASANPCSRREEYFPFLHSDPVVPDGFVLFLKLKRHDIFLKVVEE